MSVEGLDPRCFYLMRNDNKISKSEVVVLLFHLA